VESTVELTVESEKIRRDEKNKVRRRKEPRRKTGRRGRTGGG
jgi:hypothetical protein